MLGPLRIPPALHWNSWDLWLVSEEISFGPVTVLLSRQVVGADAFMWFRSILLFSVWLPIGCRDHDLKEDAGYLFN